MEEEALPGLSINKLRNDFGEKVGGPWTLASKVQTTCVYNAVCLQCQKPWTAKWQRTNRKDTRVGEPKNSETFPSCVATMVCYCREIYFSCACAVITC